MLFIKPKNFAALAFLALFSSYANASQTKDLYHYIDMPCYDLMVRVEGDAFVDFARKEISKNISDDFCGLIEDQSHGEYDYEAQRDFISMAQYSKLIDALYNEFHFADSSPAN